MNERVTFWEGVRNTLLWLCVAIPVVLLIAFAVLMAITLGLTVVHWVRWAWGL